MTGELHNLLLVGAVLFALGLLGFITRRNLILMMLSAELMLHGVSLNFVAFSRHYGHFQGQAFTVFVLTVAAAEAAIALALILTLFQRRKSLDVNVWHALNEVPPPVPSPQVEVPLEVFLEPDWPKLDPAGRIPELTPHEVESHV